MNTVTLRQLKVFAKIVEKGSFAKCAEAFDISPVAVSEHIKKMEKRLGHSIFQRAPGGKAILSDEGEKDYQHVLTILQELDALLGQSNPSKDKPQQLTITLAPYILHCMQSALTQFELNNPEVKVNLELEAVSAPEIDQQIRNNTTDIGYFYALESDECPDSRFICYEPIALYVAQSHPLAKSTLVRISDLSKTASIQTSKHNYMGKLFDHALEQIDLKGYPVSLQTDNMALYFSSLEREMAFTCMCQSAEATMYTDKLTRLSLECSLPRLQVRQVINPSLKNNSFVQQTTKQLTSLMRRA